MKATDTRRRSNSFIKPRQPWHVVRRVLLRKRLAGHRRKAKRASIGQGFSGLVLGLITLAILSLLIGGGFFVYQILAGLPDIGQLKSMAGPGGSLYQPTRFYERTGQNLIGESQTTKMEYYEFSSKSAQTGAAMLVVYAEALLAQTDTDGVDENNIITGLVRSTSIAERLVSNLLLSQESPSYIYTIRLRLLTSMAVARYGRSSLLDWFLNTADYGHGTYGAGQASQLYFKKTVSQLNPGEAMVLSAILMNPTVNPVDTPEAFDKSLQLAGSILLSAGQVNSEVLDLAASAVSGITPPIDRVNDAFYVSARNQLSGALGRTGVINEGLTVITTMDMNIQQQLECATATLLGADYPGQDCNQALTEAMTPMPIDSIPAGLKISFVLLDPATGQVKAMLGDYSPITGQQNFLLPHPSGSLVTPFIYLVGMLHGMGPASLVWDTPTGFEETPLVKYAGQYEYQGPMNIRTALIGDHLVPAAKVLDAYGRENVLALMTSFGLHLYANEGMPFESAITDNLSIAQAYGILANNGNKPGQISSGVTIADQPVTLLDVKTQDDQVVWDWKTPVQQPLISPELVFLVNDMLASGDLEAIGFRGSTKTGVSQDGLDFWRVAYTSEYVFVLWMGIPDVWEGVPLKELGVDKALIRNLDDYMQSQKWQPPAGISRLEVCYPSGLLPGDACPQTVLEYFIEGNEPLEIDTLFKQVRIDAETGKLATVFTDPARVVPQVFFNPPIEETEWSREVGYLLSPEEYSVYHSNGTGETILLEKPQNFASVQGKQDIKGEISPVAFVSFRIDLGAGLAPAQWLQVGGTQTTFPENQTFGSLDTLKYNNGLYTLRVQVLRSGNIADNAFVVILINNPQP